MTHGFNSQHKVQVYFAFLLLQGEGELARRKGGSKAWFKEFKEFKEKGVRKGTIQALTLTSVWVWAPSHLGLQNTEVLSHVKILLF